MSSVKNFFSKQSAGFYVACVTAIIAFVAIIMYIANSTHVYYEDFNGGIFIGLLGAFILMLATIIIPQFIGNNKLVSLGLVVAIILFGLLAFIFFNGRIETLAYVFGSELESENMYAQFATRQAIVTFVFMLITCLCVIACSALNVVKKDRIEG